MSNVLVVAPHPDDEAIGCGGTIRKHVVEGDDVTVLYCTNGQLGVPGVEDRYVAGEIRREEAGWASQVLQYQDKEFLDLMDGELSTADHKLLEVLSAFCSGHSIVYYPHPGESHRDHLNCALACITVLAGTGIEAWQYEIWTPLQKPDRLVDITPYASDKRNAIRSYKSQLPNAFDDAVLALNHYRGILSGKHIMYAEAFAKG